MKCETCGRVEVFHFDRCFRCRCRGAARITPQPIITITKHGRATVHTITRRTHVEAPTQGIKGVSWCHVPCWFIWWHWWPGAAGIR